MRRVQFWLLRGSTTFAYYSPGASACIHSTTQACTVVSDGNAHASTYYFDPVGRLMMRTDANGNQTSLGWDSNWNVTSVTDAMAPNGNTTTFSYPIPNPTGPTPAPHTLLGTTAPGPGAGVTYAYTNAALANRATSVTDAQANITSYVYDANGNVISLSAGGHTSTQGIQGSNASCGAKPGEVCYTTSPAGNETTYGYDTAGNLNSLSPPSPLGPTTTTFSLDRVDCGEG